MAKRMGLEESLHEALLPYSSMENADKDFPNKAKCKQWKHNDNYNVRMFICIVIGVACDGNVLVKLNRQICFCFPNICILFI